MTFIFVLHVVALVLVFLSAFSVPFSPHVHLGWLGLALWMLAGLV